MPAGHGMEFFFWGSVVRKEELTPNQARSLEFSGGDAVPLPAHSNVFYLLWAKYLMVEKAEARSLQNSSSLPEPLKFIGPRVTIDSDKVKGGSTRPVELPAPPSIKLRYPRS